MKLAGRPPLMRRPIARQCTHPASTLRHHMVRFEADGGVATITLDHPETRNALSDPLRAARIEGCARACNEEGVLCFVLTSSHEKVFSSGGNLAGFAAEVPLAHKHR